jgi:hypothetical protein
LMGASVLMAIGIAAFAVAAVALSHAMSLV